MRMCVHRVNFRKCQKSEKISWFRGNFYSFMEDFVTWTRILWLWIKFRRFSPDLTTRIGKYKYDVRIFLLYIYLRRINEFSIHSNKRFFFFFWLINDKITYLETEICITVYNIFYLSLSYYFERSRISKKKLSTFLSNDLVNIE